MPVLALNHFNLRAERVLLEKLRDFYVNVIGLTVGDRPPFSFFGYWLYIDQQAVLHLVDDSAAPKLGDASRSTFNHVAFTCSDPAFFEARLQVLGVQYRRAQVPGWNQLQLFVQDPAGNGVELNFEHAGA
jgi:catechol 2,3-dioxygenase-like lactoylglutathione lyase family enzyme